MRQAFASANARVAPASTGRGIPRLRRSDWILTAYFAYVAVLAQVLPAPPPVPLLAAGVNLAVIGGLFLLAWAESLRGTLLFSILRDWYPAPLMLLAYREMGWLAPAHHAHELERAWVVWDRKLLNDWGLRAAIELFSPVLPALLELAYLLVYSTPLFSVFMLYVYRKRERVDSFLTLFLLAILVPYAMFPYFPSEPPRAVFPGELFPSAETFFRRLNWRLLEGQGIHTSVFPSAHVAGGFAAAFGMMRLLPEHPWVGRFLLVLAVMIATAVVYGRYHYAVDALAGLAAALLALLVFTLLERRAARAGA